MSTAQDGAAARYTRLRLEPRGIVLCDYHRRRLAIDGWEEARRQWATFAVDRAPGDWAVWAGPQGLRAESGRGSRLVDGLPTRRVISPVVDRRGPLPKQSSPSPYDGVRVDRVVTLLTSADGVEIYEACSAAVIGWDGRRIVCVPDDRPRVWSTSEAAIREHLPVGEAPITARATTPILLVNAVKGPTAVSCPSRAPFPPRARAAIAELFAALTARPQNK